MRRLRLITLVRQRLAYSPPTFGFALDRLPDGNDKASTTMGDLPSPFREACGGHAPAMP